LIAWGQNCSSSMSNSQPQDMPAKTEFPAAIWRRSRQIAAGESCFCWHVLGLRIARARRAILTPGYQLPLLRSSRIVVIDQNVRASRDVAEQENSGTDCIPKPDALRGLAYMALGSEDRHNPRRSREPPVGRPPILSQHSESVPDPRACASPAKTPAGGMEVLMMARRNERSFRL
jgi:hypothetical protein